MFAHRIVGPVLCLILFKLIKFWYSFESNSFISSGVTVCPLLKNETENSRNYVTPIYAVSLRYFYSKVEHTSEFETKEKNLEHLETFRMSSFMEMVCCSAGNCDFECQPLDRALVENIDTLLKRPNGYIFTFKFIVSYFSKGWTNRNNKSCQNEKKLIEIAHSNSLSHSSTVFFPNSSSLYVDCTLRWYRIVFQNILTFSNQPICGSPSPIDTSNVIVKFV